MIDDDECYADIAYLLPCNSKKFFSGEKEDADYETYKREAYRDLGKRKITSDRRKARIIKLQHRLGNAR